MRPINPERNRQHHPLKVKEASKLLSTYIFHASTTSTSVLREYINALRDAGIDAHYIR